MREIIPSLVWLGSTIDARDLRQLHENGVASIIDLALEETIPPLSRDLVYCRFPLVDGSGNPQVLIIAAISTTAYFLRCGFPLLVTCSAGMSRSPAILAAGLALVRQGPLDGALAEIIAGRPHDVSPQLWFDVQNAYNVLVG